MRMEQIPPIEMVILGMVYDCFTHIIQIIAGWWFGTLILFFHMLGIL